jgi:hypothetical protein
MFSRRVGDVAHIEQCGNDLVTMDKRIVGHGQELARGNTEPQFAGLALSVQATARV